MTLRKYWGAEGGGRNWLLGFKSISPAKHKPEEMGSLLCAFTVVCCCCCWELRADTETACLYMAPKCTLSVRWQRRTGASVDPQLLISQTERKHFVWLTKTQFTTQHTGGGERQQKSETYTVYIYLYGSTAQCEINLHKLLPTFYSCRTDFRQLYWK